MREAYNDKLTWQSIGADRTWTDVRKLYCEITTLRPSDKIYWGSRDNTIETVIYINGFPAVEVGDRLVDGDTKYAIRHIDTNEHETICYGFSYTREVN